MPSILMKLTSYSVEALNKISNTYSRGQLRVARQREKFAVYLKDDTTKAQKCSSWIQGGLSSPASSEDAGMSAVSQVTIFVL